jgi:hypothetical protein
MIGLASIMIALFKCGLPEIPMYAAQAADGWAASNYLAAVSGVLSALALVFHHTGSIYVFAGVALGAWVPSRPLTAAIIPLIAQHMCSILRHVSIPLYVTIEVTLEVWWELEVFSALEYIVSKDLHCPLYVTMDPFAVVAVLFMLTAHWLFFLAGGIELLLRSRSEAPSSVADAALPSPHNKLRQLLHVASSSSSSSSNAPSVVFEAPRRQSSTGCCDVDQLETLQKQDSLDKVAYC